MKLIQSLVMIRYREIKKFKFAEIFRIFISGSSATGKTFFAKALLKRNLFSFSRIYYFHPDFHEHSPVDWHEDFDKPVLYQAGIPTLKDLLDIPEHSCLVFDDLFSQCCDSKDIDYLFRVLSSKRKLNVIIMTQRYFAEGKCGLSIRNSSNYHVLMRNADARTNLNVANSMQLKPEITKAIDENKTKLYPYIFIDRTNQARVNGLQIFIDILSKRFEVIIGRMKYFLISEADFKSSFTKSDKNIAYANKKKSISRKRRQYSESSSDSNESCESISSDTSTDSRESSSCESDKSTESSRQNRRKFAKIIRRNKSSSKFFSENK